MDDISSREHICSRCDCVCFCQYTPECEHDCEPQYPENLWDRLLAAYNELQECHCKSGVCDHRKAMSAAMAAVTERYGDDGYLLQKTTGGPWLIAIPFIANDFPLLFAHERDAAIVYRFIMHLHWGHTTMTRDSNRCAYCEAYFRWCPIRSDGAH